MHFCCQNHGSVAPAKNSRLSPLPPERAGFNYGIGETVDIPIDGSGVSLNSKVVNQTTCIWHSVVLILLIII